MFVRTNERGLFCNQIVFIRGFHSGPMFCNVSIEMCAKRIDWRAGERDKGWQTEKAEYRKSGHRRQWPILEILHYDPKVVLIRKMSESRVIIYDRDAFSTLTTVDWHQMTLLYRALRYDPWKLYLVKHL